MGSSTARTRRLMMTAYGWNDSGGGTAVPRTVAKELARRGWDVTVFHPAVRPNGTGIPYELREWVDDGVRLIGVHNRPHGLFDIGHPLRELDDPPITAAFAAALDRLRPDVVHFHNLANLGAALIAQVAARGIPSYFTTHNHWLLCPRAYLLDGRGAFCPGPGDGRACAGCVGSADARGHERRFAEIRASANAGCSAILAVSTAVRRALLAGGYDPELVDVVRQAMPFEGELWDAVGRDRGYGQSGPVLSVGFLGSALPLKGPQLLVAAAQRTEAQLRVRIIGDVPSVFAKQLQAMDNRGVVELSGAFERSEMAALLRTVDVVALPSMCWDSAPLVAAECLAARVPLVVPRLAGLAEAVRDGIDGLTFNALDAADLARTLDRLALQDGLLERLQQGIRRPRAFAEHIDELEAYYAGERPGAVREPPDAAGVAVRWKGDHDLPTSLSIINDRVGCRLRGPLQRVARSGAALDGPLPHLADVEVRHQWPPDLSAPRAGALAAIVPWEFGAVPTDWLAQIERNVDELWVPSEYVRGMYLEGGVPPDRVHAIPNGVDLELFAPNGPRLPGAGTTSKATRFLFVGGLIWRKGPDLLLDAWKLAFDGRDDVTLVIKDFGADSLYRGADRTVIRQWAQSGMLPRIELWESDLTPDELAALYRSCDILVHPYRGEGFAMPVLEAMACGLPVIVTAGGPTDEFCPDGACWRIRSRRAHMPGEQVDTLPTAGRPWVLEPDPRHLVELLAAAHRAGADERHERGQASRAAAQRYSWDAVAARYAERIADLAARRPRRFVATDRFPLAEDVGLRVLATPSWRGEDSLGELLREWSDATTSATRACLYLLADPSVAGSLEQITQSVMSAAQTAGADLDACADVNVLIEPLTADRDERLHAAVDAYVPLHDGCAGHLRIARAAGSTILPLRTSALQRTLNDAINTYDLARAI
ncbi:MAG: glycosyltransferase [Solirubrobacteraceae bacterium]